MVKAKLEGQIILNYTIVTEVEDLKELPNEYESLVLSENYQELLLKSELISVKEISMDIEKAKEIKAIKVRESYDFLFEGKNNEYDEEYKDYIEKENVKLDIQEILAKYENFYKGGSGYTFQVEVDDFNALLVHISELESRILKVHQKATEQIEKLEKEIVEHCETKGLAGRQVFTLTKRVDELIEERKAQAEKIDHLKEVIKKYDVALDIEQKEKKTIATILAYVEKNHDAPEIEEYLWKMLDKGTEFE